MNYPSKSERPSPCISGTAVHVEDVGKSYPVFTSAWDRLKQVLFGNRSRGYKEHWALRGVTFDLEKGASVGVIGRNGSGKSTLLQIISGTLTPTSGNVKVDGVIGALLELGSGFNPEFTGRENVFLNGSILGLRRKEISERFRDIEVFAEIGDYIDQPVKTYSSGMMVRLAFAVQTVIEPEILIVDEALSVGDIFFAQKCARRMNDLRDGGTSLLFVSHDMGAVRDLCQKVLVLHDGEPIYWGDTEDGIRTYFQTASSRFLSYSDPDKSDTLRSKMEKAADIHLERYLWRSEVLGGASTAVQKGRILGIDVRNQSGLSTLTCEMGSRMNFYVLYQSPAQERIHVTVILKNRRDQTIYSGGSYTLRKDPPRSNASGKLLFKLALEMAVEAGEYTFSVNLGKLSQGTFPVVKVDESPPLGPLRIRWDYETKRPPFFGMFGLRSEASFHEASF